jgi:methionine synthase II (cobalamin-independent)
MSLKHRPVLLIGSFPYKSPRDVFEVAGPALAGFAARLPDGEAQGWNTFPAATLAKAQGLVPSGRMARMQPEMPPYPLYQIKNGGKAEDIRFAPIGYDTIALQSYAAFKDARENGNIAPGTKFQVSLPTPFATIGARVIPEHVPAVLPVFEQNYFREVDEIVRAIPASDLAIQWDVAVEIIQSLEGNRPGLKEHAPLEFLAAALARAIDRVPASVEVGFHLCYGNPGGRHIIEPKDTQTMVDLANATFAAARRAITWLHMPVPKNRDDDAYFAPLQHLKLPRGTEFYLGLVHLSDGREGAKRRMTAAQKFAPPFGVAYECGLRAFAKDVIPEMLALHREAACLT